MKKWKSKLFLGLGAIPVTIAPIASSVAMSVNVDQKQNDDLTFNKLYDLLHNSKKLNALIVELPDHNNLVKEARQSTEYSNFVHWIKEQSYQVQMDDTLVLKEIESTNLSRELKLWLLKNYADKYWMALLNDPEAPVASNRNYGVFPSTGSYWASAGGKSVGYDSIPKPEPKPRTYLSNNLYFVDAQNKVVEYKDDNDNTIPRRGIDDKTTSYSFTTDQTWFYFSNQTVFEHGIVMLAELGKEMVGKVVTNMVTSPAGSVAEQIVKSIDIANKTSKFASKFIASSLTSTIFTIASLDWKNDPTGSAQALATSIGVSALSFAASSIIAGGLPGAIVGLAVSLILDAIPTGNGHSIASNMSDHGLNDWDYQWRKNSKVMKELEIEWSDQYKYGIVWQVIDTWIELPEIFIATQGLPSTRQHLSPGDSFNWGHSIAFRNKS